eukprot:10209351-Prorocentrum_lima.AAC.1
MLLDDGGGAGQRAHGEQARPEWGFARPAVRSEVELLKIHGIDGIFPGMWRSPVVLHAISQ